jgi:hypothetical protein
MPKKISKISHCFFLVCFLRSEMVLAFVFRSSYLPGIGLYVVQVTGNSIWPRTARFDKVTERKNVSAVV